jgi:hypothetical protein
VTIKHVINMSEVKTQHQVPFELQGCHTAIVDGYVLEGHVPALEIERLIAEKPDISGLAVPGMPVGAPGMEIEGIDDQPFDVVAFDDAGKREVFARYGK